MMESPKWIILSIYSSSHDTSFSSLTYNSHSRISSNISTPVDMVLGNTTGGTIPVSI